MTRIIATFVAIMLGTLSAASADEVVVQRNNVALRAEPSKNGKVEWRVNEGYQLSVIGQEGNWLEVSVPNLAEPNRNLWVQAKLVAPVEAPADAGTIDADFRLELDGSLGAKFKSKCVFLNPGDSFRHVQWDHGSVPATVDIHGAAALCIVRTIDSSDRIGATLIGRDGTKLAATSTGDSARSLVVRSDGPWGAAAGRSGGGPYMTSP
ncbi:MAG: hypothetical protein ACREEE_16585 [Dongiaceae bacterium]